MLAAATEHPFRWQPHPEIWVLMLGILGLAVYAVRVIGPRATHDDETIVTRSQKAWFFAAWITLWVAIDWPMHDIAEEYRLDPETVTGQVAAVIAEFDTLALVDDARTIDLRDVSG